MFIIDYNLYTSVYDLDEILVGKAEKKKIKAELRRCVINDEAPKGPVYIMLKISNRCNSDCAYCVHAFSNSKELRTDPDTQLLLRIIREAGEMGVSAMTITGGEALLRNDVELLVKEMRDNKITPVLLTNGILLPSRYESLGEAGLRYIIISIDSLDPHVYKLQRGIDFSLAKAGIDAALAFKDKYNDAHVHVTVVLTKNNADELPSFIKYMTDMGIYVQISPYHHFNPSVPNTLRITDPEKMFSLTAEILKMKREGALIANSNQFISHFPDFFLNNQRIPVGYKCPVGYMDMFIDAHMNVRGCWDEKYGNMGSAKEMSLKDIWDSKKYCEERKKMLQCCCDGCWYLCTGEQTAFITNEEL